MLEYWAIFKRLSLIEFSITSFGKGTLMSLLLLLSLLGVLAPLPALLLLSLSLTSALPEIL